MKILARTLTVALLAPLVAGCPRPAEREAGEDLAPATWQQDAEQGFRQFHEAWNRGDAVAVASMFTDDAVIMPPDGPRVAGRAAIQQYYEREFAGWAGSPSAAPTAGQPGAAAPGVRDTAPGSARPPGDQPPGTQQPAGDTTAGAQGAQQPGAGQQPGIGQQPGTLQQPAPGGGRMSGSIESSAAAGEWGWSAGDIRVEGAAASPAGDTGAARTAPPAAGQAPPPAGAQARPAVPAGSGEMKFVAVSRRGADGVWRLHRLIWNRTTGGTLEATGQVGGPNLGTRTGPAAPGRQ